MSSSNTENNMKTTDHHEDFSDNLILEEMESSVEDIDESYISTRSIQNKDAEKTISIAPTAFIPEAAISVPSTSRKFWKKLSRQK
ncbi:amorpha- -diene synthase [Lasius niger]|uniref:Amorpha--diene synthase n=1 Tax=Lasius niger TaxID=67767 RepID=A0A0J7KD43_LASNI|nr:amorpha- -diene synthase [Lasius niger]